MALPSFITARIMALVSAVGGGGTRSAPAVTAPPDGGSVAMPFVPGHALGGVTIDDDQAAKILRTSLGEWNARLGATPARERVDFAAEVFVRALFDRQTRPEDVGDLAFYPHLELVQARAALPRMRHVLHQVLGLERAGVRAVESARARRAADPLELRIDLDVYAAAVPRIDDALRLIEAMNAGPLAHELRRELREVRAPLTYAIHRRDELDPRANGGGLLRSSTPADDVAAAALTNHGRAEWAALVTGDETFAVPANLTAFETRRGERAALGLLEYVLTRGDHIFTTADAFYPGYAQHDDVGLRRRLRGRILKLVGLEHRDYDRAVIDETGYTVRPANLHRGLRPVQGPDALVQIELRLLAAIERIQRLRPTFLSEAVDQALCAVRAEMLEAAAVLYPNVNTGADPAVRSARAALDLRADEVFVTRVMAMNDPRLTEALVTMWRRGELRSDPTFLTRAPRASQRTNTFDRGPDALIIRLEHELEEDRFVREQAARHDRRTSAMLRARWVHLKDAFSKAAREDCERRMGKSS